MQKTVNISTSEIISEWFGGTPQNIRKTYEKNKPSSYRVLDIGSYVLEHGISEQELVVAIDNYLKSVKVYNEKRLR